MPDDYRTKERATPSQVMRKLFCKARATQPCEEGVDWVKQAQIRGENAHQIQAQSLQNKSTMPACYLKAGWTALSNLHCVPFLL